jgi:hypothetical protein
VFFVATTGGTSRPALTRWRPALRALAVVLVMALGVTGMTACGNNNQPEQISRPVDDQGHTLYGPVVNGVAYCGWVLSADECKDATEPTGTPIPAEHWVKMPDQNEAQGAGQSVERHDDSNLLWRMLEWHMIYHLWFGSPAYYGRYYPVGSPMRDRYTSTIGDFDSRSSRYYSSYDSRARYATASGKVVTGDKVSARNFTVKNSGGDKGTGAKPCALPDTGTRTGLPDVLAYATAWTTAARVLLVATGVGGPLELVLAKGSSGGKSSGSKGSSGGGKAKTTNPGDVGGDKSKGRSQNVPC